MRDVLFVFFLTCVHAWIPEDVNQRSLRCTKKGSWRCILRDNVLDCKNFHIQLNASRGVDSAKLNFVDKLNSTNIHGTCEFFTANRHVTQTKFRCLILDENKILKPSYGRGSCNCLCKISKKNTLTRLKYRRSTLNKISTTSNPMPCLTPIMGVISSKNRQRLTATVKIWYNSTDDTYSEIFVRVLRFPDGENGNCSIFKENVKVRGTWNLHKVNEMYKIDKELELNVSGNYCVKVALTKCIHEDWVYEFTLSTDNQIVYLSSPLSPTKHDTTWYFPVGVVAVLFIILTIGLIICYKRRNTQRNIRHNLQQAFTSESLLPNIKKKLVFLAYDRRNPNRDEVRLFAELLEKYFYCEVSYEERDQREIIIDSVGVDYMKKQLKSKTIIIINSEEAFIRQNKIAREDTSEPPFLDWVFDTFLGMAMSKTDLWADYDKFIHVRFEYTSQQYILKYLASDVHYEIPKDLRKFFVRLHSLDSKLVDDHSSLPSSWEGEEIYLKFHEAVSKAAKKRNFVKDTVLNVDTNSASVESPSSSTNETSLDSESVSDCESATSRKNLLKDENCMSQFKFSVVT